MIYWEIFKANFTANILGYGGGPATIPLLEYEVVHRYGWFSISEYSEMVALGNGLPGPIATKLAGYIGYELAGVLGAFVGLLGTVAPSLILMIVLLSFLLKFKNSSKVSKLTQYIRPTIAVLLGVMTFNFLFNSNEVAGTLHTAILVVSGILTLEFWKISPTYVVLGSLIYGAVFLG